MENRGRSLFILPLIAAAMLLTAADEPGKQFFQENCSMCHNTGGGEDKVGPDLAKVSQRLDENSIRTKMAAPDKTNPDSPMPSFKDMPKEQFEAIVQYLKGLK